MCASKDGWRRERVTSFEGVDPPQGGVCLFNLMAWDRGNCGVHRFLALQIWGRAYGCIRLVSVRKITPPHETPLWKGEETEKVNPILWYEKSFCSKCKEKSCQQKGQMVYANDPQGKILCALAMTIMRDFDRGATKNLKRGG